MTKQYIPQIYFGEEGYLQSIKDILEFGEKRNDRTGVGTISLFQLQYRYDLTKGFPLLTTKKMAMKSIFEELMWFLRGQTDVSILQNKGIKIWDGNSTREFLDTVGLKNLQECDIGPSYGFQFRYAGAEYQNCKTNYIGQGLDQVQYVIDQLKTNPHSRRILINLWNCQNLSQMALPPCLFCYEFYVKENNKLCLALIQRSGDIMLGIPFNIASATLLLHIIARETGLQPWELVHNINDAHIYINHIEGAKEQILRKPFAPPILQLKHIERKFTDYEFTDVVIENYNSHPTIKLNMAI